jgi:hypothetical protein
LVAPIGPDPGTDALCGIERGSDSPRAGGPAPIPAAPAPQGPKVTPPQITPAPAITNPSSALFQHGASSGNTHTDNADTISGGTALKSTISSTGSNVLLTPLGSKNRDTISTFSQVGADRDTIFGGVSSGQKIGISDTIASGTGTRGDTANPDTLRGGGGETRTGGGATVQGGTGTDRNAYSGTKTVNQGTVPVTGSGFNGTFQAPSNTPTR